MILNRKSKSLEMISNQNHILCDLNHKIKIMLDIYN